MSNAILGTIVFSIFGLLLVIDGISGVTKRKMIIQPYRGSFNLQSITGTTAVVYGLLYIIFGGFFFIAAYYSWLQH